MKSGYAAESTISGLLFDLVEDVSSGNEEYTIFHPFEVTDSSDLNVTKHLDPDVTTVSNIAVVLLPLACRRIVSLTENPS